MNPETLASSSRSFWFYAMDEHVSCRVCGTVGEQASLSQRTSPIKAVTVLRSCSS